MCDIVLVQILAGNARKVGAIRFERISNGDTMLETKGVTRLFPKIVKRKCSDDEDSDGTEYDESFPRRQEDGLANEDQDDHHSRSRQ